MKIEQFEDLEVWQEARKFAKKIFEISKKDPFVNDFRLRDQIRASTGSIMDNIAEGYERGGTKEFLQFLSISKASCGESRSQCYRALDYGYISQEIFEDLIKDCLCINRQISGFMKYLSSSNIKGTKYK